jgi:hypothetical protein
MKNTLEMTLPVIIVAAILIIASLIKPARGNPPGIYRAPAVVITRSPANALQGLKITPCTTDTECERVNPHAALLNALDEVRTARRIPSCEQSAREFVRAGFNADTYQDLPAYQSMIDCTLDQAN